MHSYSVITLTHTRAFVSNLTTQFCWCPLGLASRECLYLPPPHPADAERKTRQGVTSVYRWYRQCYAFFMYSALLDEGRFQLLYQPRAARNVHLLLLYVDEFVH
jgi:hypothetical protein